MVSRKSQLFDVSLKMKRRTFIQSAMAMPVVLSAEPLQNRKSEESMYGIIGKMTATEGNRDKLIEILRKGTKSMPGCKIYAISADTVDVTGIRIYRIFWSDDVYLLLL